MSQKSVEMLLGKILTDEGFRDSFFPGPALASPGPNFETADVHGLELTAVERSALRSLRRASFDALAASLDARICRSCEPDAPGDRS